mmetsp:Transcript_24677/g.72183  ORF Transcript_24677/g.72183 Transcript_24677/m.72183 type:complete len:303 (+) Transcript_24677:289-1197(+)
MSPSSPITVLRPSSSSSSLEQLSSPSEVSYDPNELEPVVSSPLSPDRRLLPASEVPTVSKSSSSSSPSLSLPPLLPAELSLNMSSARDDSISSIFVDATAGDFRLAAAVRLRVSATIVPPNVDLIPDDVRPDAMTICFTSLSSSSSLVLVLWSFSPRFEEQTDDEEDSVVPSASGVFSSALSLPRARLRRAARDSRVRSISDPRSHTSTATRSTAPPAGSMAKVGIAGAGSSPMAVGPSSSAAADEAASGLATALSLSPDLRDLPPRRKSLRIFLVFFFLPLPTPAPGDDGETLLPHSFFSD